MPVFRKLLHDELLRQRLSPETALTVERHPFSILLDNTRSAYNVGSIFRSCDAALVPVLILTGYTPPPTHKEVKKTALGATETVPWQHFPNSVEAADYLENTGRRIIAVELTDFARPYGSLTRADFPCCFILGNELTGISPELLHRAHDAIEIPMFGVKHSLNVAVAAGIVLFEAVRKWRAFSSDSI